MASCGRIADAYVETKSTKKYTPGVWRIVMIGEVRQWLHEVRPTDPDTLRQISDALDPCLRPKARRWAGRSSTG